jgi:hypothetical protein
LLKDDLEAVKLTDKIATADNNTFLSFTARLLSDQSGVAPIPIASTAAKQTAVFVRDSTAPLLTTVIFDLNAGMLNLSFSETVRKSTLEVAQITLQDALSSASESVQLGAGEVIGSDGLELSYALSKSELDDVTARTLLCVSNSSCVMNVNSDSVDDMASNALVAITRGVSDFVVDTTAPTLVTFNFTYDVLGSVSLEFYETMKQTSLNITGITLQDNATSNVKYTLVGASNDEADGTTFLVELNKTDIDELKRLGICITKEGCFITLESSTMTDMSDLAVVAVVDGDARQATSLSADVITPEFVTTLELDYNAETLTLSFDEPVEPSSLNASAVSLSDALSASDIIETQVLTNGSTASLVGSTIVFQFDNNDMNALKLNEDLCKKVSGTDCFVTLDTTFIKDASGNQLTTRTAEKTAVVKDITPPEVSRVDIDMEGETITVTFGEPVIDATSKLSGITLTNSLVNPTVSIKLGSRTEVTSADVDSVNVTFGLSTGDVLKIKDDFTLCTSIDDCVVSVAVDTAFDISGNTNAMRRRLSLATHRTRVVLRLSVSRKRTPPLES